MTDAKGGQTFLTVTPEQLNNKATDLTAGYPTQLVGSPLPPCLLTLSGMAAQILVQSHERLSSVVKRGAYEAEHLAERLRTAAKAYDDLDRALGEQIASGQPSGADAPPLAPPLSAGKPAPDAPSGSSATPTDDGLAWETAVQQFDAGDQCQALLAYKESLTNLGNELTNHGKKFSLGNVHWEGRGSEEAEMALRKHESWMYDTAQQIWAFAKQVNDFADAHFDEHSKHPTAADVEYVDALQGTGIYLPEYAKYQAMSDLVRQNYASRVAFSPINFENPPLGPGSKNASLPDAKKKNEGGGGGSQTGGGGGGGGQPSGGQPQPESPSTNPASAGAGKPEGGGSPSGGSSSGGGSPSGGSGQGSPSGGMPSGLGGDKPEMPSLPDGPGVSPASAGGGAGGGSGGGGGGLGGQPMQPAAVAPALGTGDGAAAGGASQAAGRPPVGGGGMGGGMGGGGHGGNREGGKEKKRNANLSPDEVLYKEDRAFTDGVIGHRRRTKIDDKKDTK